MTTPRLREYFPETLLWEPSLITDRRGRAKLNVKLADNITTWNLYVTASTKSGEIGKAPIDLRAFQPFFIEHDPPKVLTEGDVIEYPVILRDYLDRQQTVTASIKPDSWFKLVGPAMQRVTIEPGEAARAVFRYQATTAGEEVKQRVTAASRRTGDSSEKVLAVHPFGTSESQSDTELIESKITLSVRIPEKAISGYFRGELKIYPNLLAHAIEGMEGVMEIPNGCGEQTISSAYPSLLIAEYYEKNGTTDSAIARKARRYLQAGYDRLLGYQNENGGFTYWGSGEPSVALTAYAIEFLRRSARIMDVDSTVIERATKWLLLQQLTDGSWRTRDQQSESEALIRSAYVVRTLSDSRRVESHSSGTPDPTAASIDRAVEYFTVHRDLGQEPYAVASFALALMVSGQDPSAAPLLDALRQSVHREGNGAYWSLEMNTPFYGWGRTGRLESTALATRALAASNRDQELVRQGLLFLLNNKDAEGIWYSGQTTINVLETLLTLLPSGRESSHRSVTLRVNGQNLRQLELPPPDEVVAPLTIDLKENLKLGNNLVEVEQGGESLPISAQLLFNKIKWLLLSSASNSLPLKSYACLLPVSEGNSNHP